MTTHDGHDGLINDCEIIFIDQTDSSDPTRREFLWIRVLKTIAPFRLNIDKVTLINVYPELISISACIDANVRDKLIYSITCDYWNLCSISYYHEEFLYGIL